MTTSNNTNLETKWNAYNNRGKAQIKLDLLNIMCDKRVHKSLAAQILFAAGYTINSERVEAFYKGRKHFMANRVAESNAKYEQAQQEELLV